MLKILLMVCSISSSYRRPRSLGLITGLCLLAIACQSLAFDTGEVPSLGTQVDESELATRDTLVFPDGSGLPEGRGNVETGSRLYVQHCLLCHGPNARGGSGEELSGGIADLTRDPPDQTIGTYWPFATTLFDFIRRAMPMHLPGILSNDDAYALTAYLLHENGILPVDARLDAESLKNVRMPNRDGFIWIDVDADGKLSTR